MVIIVIFSFTLGRGMGGSVGMRRVAGNSTGTDSNIGMRRVAGNSTGSDSNIGIFEEVVSSHPLPSTCCFLPTTWATNAVVYHSINVIIAKRLGFNCLPLVFHSVCLALVTKRDRWLLTVVEALGLSTRGSLVAEARIVRC